MGAEPAAKWSPYREIRRSAPAEIEIGEILRHTGQVGDGRGHARLKGLDQHRILDGRPQGMTGKALGVGDGHAPVMLRIGAAQGVHLGIGAPAPGRREGFVAHEDQRRGVSFRRKAVSRLDAADEPGHLAPHMVHFDTGAVKGAVADIGSENFRLSAHSPPSQGVGPLHDQGDRAAAEDGAVSIGVKGLGRLGHHRIDGGRPQGQKPRGHPGALGLGGGRFSADDDHPVAAAGADPVLGHPDGLGGGGAGPAHLHIGTPRTDELGEMGRTQGGEVKEQGPVELVVAVPLAPFLDFEEPVGDLRLDLGIGHRRHEMVVDVLQFLVGPDVELVVVVIVHLVDEGFKARKKGGEDDAGAGLHFLGQGVAVGKALARGGFFVPHHQRNLRVL